MNTIKNKTLARTAKIIPYIKELNEITGSVTATILMQQLDYWFANSETNTYDHQLSKYGPSFYKFLEPSTNKYYKTGDSWVEELGFSKHEFRTAFDKIGIRYSSKEQFLKQKDPFKGKFYCSYFDRIKGLTFYFRNHDLADQEIERVLSKEKIDTFDNNVKSAPSEVIGSTIKMARKSVKCTYEGDSRKSGFRRYVNPDSGDTEIRNPDFHYTENTTENTTKIGTYVPADFPDGKSAVSMISNGNRNSLRNEENIQELLYSTDQKKMSETELEDTKILNNIDCDDGKPQLVLTEFKKFCLDTFGESDYLDVVRFYNNVLRSKFDSKVSRSKDGINLTKRKCANIKFLLTTYGRGNFMRAMNKYTELFNSGQLRYKPSIDRFTRFIEKMVSSEEAFRKDKSSASTKNISSVSDKSSMKETYVIPVPNQRYTFEDLNPNDTVENEAWNWSYKCKCGAVIENYLVDKICKNCNSVFDWESVDLSFFKDYLA